MLRFATRRSRPRCGRSTIAAMGCTRATAGTARWATRSTSRCSIDQKKRFTAEGAEIAQTTLDTERRQPERFGSGCAAWSGLPVVTVRLTVFLEGFFVLLAAASVRDADELALPMGGNDLS